MNVAPTTFVFGCCEAADDWDPSGVKRPYLLISLSEDWLGEQRMSDYYEDEQHERIEAACQACGFEAAEAIESTYEIVGATVQEVRDRLSQHPDFTYDQAFEQRMGW